MMVAYKCLGTSLSSIKTKLQVNNKMVPADFGFYCCCYQHPAFKESFAAPSVHKSFCHWLASLNIRGVDRNNRLFHLSYLNT